MKYFLLLENGEIEEAEAGNILDVPAEIRGKLVVSAAGTRPTIEAVRDALLDKEEHKIG